MQADSLTAEPQGKPTSTVAATKSLQSCPTLCDPITAAHQAPLSLGFSRQKHWSGLPFPSPTHACMLSHFSRVQLWVTPWTAAHQAPLSTGFSRQESLSGWPCPSPFKERERDKERQRQRRCSTGVEHLRKNRLEILRKIYGLTRKSFLYSISVGHVCFQSWM